MLYLRTVATVDRRVAMPPETPEGRTVATLAAVTSACWKARSQLDRLVGAHPELTAHVSVRTGASALRRAWRAVETTLEGIDAGHGHPHDDLEARS